MGKLWKAIRCKLFHRKHIQTLKADGAIHLYCAKCHRSVVKR